MITRLAAIALAAGATGCVTPPESVEKPDVIVWGAGASDMETALDGLCENGMTTRKIDPPFLPNVQTEQLQIDCDGFEFFGAPRWTEFVIGDDRLQMVWIMVDREDEAAAIAAMKSAYGAPSHENDAFVAFAGERTAWRSEPPEFLFYTPELAEGMEAFFATGGE